MTRSLESDTLRPASGPQSLPEAADLVLSHLEAIGVEFVFGVPGGAIEPLYNALARSGRRGGIKPIVARHEAGAAFMADGYARETGKLGVCCTTTGPGATNAITGIASAYQDDIPMLVITAQTPLGSFGRGAVQESSCTGINTVAMMEHCTHYNSLVSHIDQLEIKLAGAIGTAFHARGPAHLSIPLDILRMPLGPTAGRALRLESLTYEPKAIDPALAARLAARVQEARHIVVVTGEGCQAAMPRIMEFVERRGALLVTTPQGKGLADPYHPNFRGVCGLAGHKGAQQLLLHPEVDLVLVVGTAVDEQATQGWMSRPALAGKLVHIDSLPRNFIRSLRSEFHVPGNIEQVFEYLLTTGGDGRARPWDMLDSADTCRPNVVHFDRRYRERRASSAAQSAQDDNRRRSDRRSSAGGHFLNRRFMLADERGYRSSAVPIKPQRLMFELSRLFPPGTRFLADIGNSFLWALHYLHPCLPKTGASERPNNYYRTSMGFASMGWAIGAAVGTALANRKHPVVCIVGDGSLLMSGQDITTAVMHGLTVIFVVLNDQALGTVKHGQRLAGAEQVAYELPPVDFAALARAMGIEAHRIESPDDMMQLDVGAMCRRHGPTLLDVYIDGEEIPPLYERMDMLTSQP